MAAENRYQLSGFTLYVELVICFTPMLASAATRFSALSFTKGITGSIRTETGIPLLTKSSAALRRLLGDGACGSRSFALPSSSVVIVSATDEEILPSKSSSRVTMLDFVIIWIRQLFSTRISKHFLVNPAVASSRGYGSEEFAIETISPFTLAASLFRVYSNSWFA